MKPSDQEICYMLTECREVIDSVGIPVIRADRASEPTTALIIPACYAGDVTRLLSDCGLPGKVTVSGVSATVQPVFFDEN